MAEYGSVQRGCGDALEFEDSCYFFIDEPTTGSDAQRQCEEIEANLISIHSDEENFFIGALKLDYSNFE